MNEAEVVGYTFAEQSFCTPCVHDLFVPIGLIDPPERSIDEILNLVAAARDIQQRHDENSFTTYRLPKPIYVADAFSADVCFLCGEPLLSNPGPNPN